jgi:hypothetical protein
MAPLAGSIMFLLLGIPTLMAFVWLIWEQIHELPWEHDLEKAPRLRHHQGPAH